MEAWNLLGQWISNLVSTRGTPGKFEKILMSGSYDTDSDLINPEWGLGMKFLKAFQWLQPQGVGSFQTLRHPCWHCVEEKESVPAEHWLNFWFVIKERIIVALTWLWSGFYIKTPGITIIPLSAVTQVSNNQLINMYLSCACYWSGTEYRKPRKGSEIWEEV